MVMSSQGCSVSVLVASNIEHLSQVSSLERGQVR
jgi:hypothetical protein